MNIVFMGTAIFAVPALQALATPSTPAIADRAQDIPGASAAPTAPAVPTVPAPYNVKLVLTRPVAAGRGKALAPSPVQACAEQLNIPTITPTSFYLPRDTQDAQDAQDTLATPTTAPRTLDPQLINLITSAQPDFIVVAAYGLLLPPQILDLPTYGSINIHGSLLPRWRGAAPIQRAILAGDPQSGVCITRMEAGLDTGPVCRSASTPLAGKDYAQLTQELAQTGAHLLLEALPSIANGTAVWQDQPQEGASYADKIGKSELDLSPNLSANLNIRKVLASSPQTPARCMIGTQAVTILAASPPSPQPPANNPTTNNPPTSNPSIPNAAPPSSTVLYQNKQLLFGTDDGCFVVTTLKPDGKKAMDAPSFVAGNKALQKGSAAPPTWSPIKRETL